MTLITVVIPIFMLAGLAVCLGCAIYIADDSILEPRWSGFRLAAVVGATPLALALTRRRQITSAFGVACTLTVLLFNWRLRLWLKKPEVAEFNRQSRYACVRACVRACRRSTR